MIYDLCVVGTGIAGMLCALKVSLENKNAKILMIDAGRPPLKRKLQMTGYLGCLAGTDGKLFLNDLKKVSDISNARKTKAAYKWFSDYMSKFMQMKVIKDKLPSANLQKKIKKNNFEIVLNDWIQMYPKEMHLLSKHSSNIFYDNQNVEMIFDNEVSDIKKEKKHFIIYSEKGEYAAKKVVLATGRAGWRWVKDIYNKFGLIESNDIAKFGIRAEISASSMKDFNKSNCSISNSELEIGPFCWNGTVIPEDHTDLVISSFRSNENRWKTDKVSFNIIGSRTFSNQGVEQNDRIGKLIFILANDRVIKEKISNILNKKSQLSVIKECDWLGEAVEKTSIMIPDIIEKGYFHIPTLIPSPPKINLGNNMETEVDGLYAVGEASGITGILASALSGLIAADGMI